MDIYAEDKKRWRAGEKSRAEQLIEDFEQEEREERELEKVKKAMTKREIRQAVRREIAYQAESILGHWTEHQESGYGDPRLTTDDAIDIAAEEIDRLFKFFKVD